MNKRSRVPAKILNILKSGSLWKYLSNDINALIIPFILRFEGFTTISPSTIVVSAHSGSTLNPVRSANDPFAQIIR